MTGIVGPIRQKPGEHWLIIHHKASKKSGDLPSEVMKRLPKELFVQDEATGLAQVNFLNWGRHQADNRFRDVDHIILAGTLFLRDSQYEALKRLGAARPAEDQVTKAEVRQIAHGEHSHAILQALCRGSARKSDGDGCRPCEAYIIASPRSGIHGLLPKVFPHCTVANWLPVEREPTGKVGEAFKLVREWAENAVPGDLMKFDQVQRAVGMDRSNFKSEIRKSTTFIAACQETCVLEWAKNKYLTHWVKA